MVDGDRFDFSDGKWKPIGDIYRYIVFHGFSRTGKPILVLKGRQVGMTVGAISTECYATTSGEYGNIDGETVPIRLVHALPTLVDRNKFSKEKLAPILDHSVDNFLLTKLTGSSATGIKDTQSYKQFEFGTLKVESVGRNAVRLQGSTYDGIFFDEVQRMFQNDINNALKTLTHAKYGPPTEGIQVYFGTPLNRGSHFNTMWDMSEQHYFNFRCIDCEEFFPLYTVGCKDEWKKIWIEGYTIKCPHCGILMDKREGASKNGKWLSVTENPDDKKYIGFHINQMLIPIFTKEAILKGEPNAKNLDASERDWYNEILGEFYSGYGATLTRDDIYNHCRDDSRAFAKFIKRDNGKRVYMGIDWGGKIDTDNASTGQSYSTLVVISVTNGHILDVEYAFKFKSQKFQYKMEIIEEMYRRYNVDYTVADVGYGQDICDELQRKFGASFLSANASGNQLDPIKYKKDLWQIGYNKDIMIEKVFEMCKRGQIKFPWKSFEKIDWLIDHCTSMESEDRVVNGVSKKKYVKGNGPNDGLMSLMYAMMAREFDRTNAFTIDTRIKDSNKYNRKVSAISAYLPGIK
jgi:hypothetical protein